MGWTNTSPSVITANKVIIEGDNGVLLVYSGTPALGNLVLAICGTGVANPDPYGNVYSEVLQVGDNWKTVIDDAAQYFQYNSEGATLHYWSPENAVFIRYHDNSSAVQGGVRYYLSGGPYTDAYGNVIGPGLGLTELPPPAAANGFGQVYVGNGTGGTANGALYYMSPAGTVTQIAAA